MTASELDRGTGDQGVGADREVGAGRVMVVWCPDWSVVAARAEEELVPDAPIAVISRGEVYACSPTARAEGVRVGLRRRDAVGRCPELIVLDHQPDRDLRVFGSVLAAMEQVTPGVMPMVPGRCAVRVPSRYYGGETEAAAVIAEHLVGTGVWDCRIGIADGVFAAEQAARLADQQSHLAVPPGGSADFLAPLPIRMLEEPELVSLLSRLGIKTLGTFARLSARDVLTRFGRPGARLHRLAGGEDVGLLASRTPPLEFTRSCPFEPGLTSVETIGFSIRRTADAFVSELARHGLVCTTVRIEVEAESGYGESGPTDGWIGTRRWAHPRWFGSADLIDRVRWQLQADPAPAPVIEVRLIPDGIEPLSDQGEGLWGSAPDERIERGIARLQSMLGPEGVLAVGLQGGRGPAARQSTTPWGEQAVGRRPAELPWPGSIPPPAPTRVFAERLPAMVYGPSGRPVTLTDRGLITAEPTTFTTDPDTDPTRRIHSWAGPWPIEELWWDPAKARRVARFQVVGVDGSAWLLVLENGRWYAEARYE